MPQPRGYCYVRVLVSMSRLFVPVSPVYKGRLKGRLRGQDWQNFRRGRTAPGEKLKVPFVALYRLRQRAMDNGDSTQGKDRRRKPQKRKIGNLRMDRQFSWLASRFGGSTSTGLNGVRGDASHVDSQSAA